MLNQNEVVASEAQAPQIDNTLSQKETRLILTPFAFKIDQSLFGLPLASPFKRACAILIDLSLVAMLSDAPGEILALLIAIVFYRLGHKSIDNQQVKGKKRRRILRGFSFLMVLIVLLNVLPTLFNYFKGGTAEEGLVDHYFINESVIDDSGLINVAGEPLSTFETIAFSALSAKVLLAVDDSDCLTLACWQNELTPLVKEFTPFDLSTNIINEATQTMVKETNLVASEQEKLKNALINTYQDGLENEVPKDVEVTKVITSEGIVDASNKEVKSDRPVYSVIKWVQGIIEDLGLGFGWAAFYFTVFTASWQGKTPGKKLLGIRVLHLNGKKLSMWESFARYGGYGAGIATGLLGFLQIFWNPNRQAIQDQISATVVIDERKMNER